MAAHWIAFEDACTNKVELESGRELRTSLAQVGHWLVGRGQVPMSEMKNVEEEFTPEEIKRWSMTSTTPVGRLHHLAPALRLSETPPYWARPTVPLGHHQPVWPQHST